MLDRQQGVGVARIRDTLGGHRRYTETGVYYAVEALHTDLGKELHGLRIPRTLAGFCTFRHLNCLALPFEHSYLRASDLNFPSVFYLLATTELPGGCLNYTRTLPRLDALLGWAPGLPWGGTVLLATQGLNNCKHFPRLISCI